jgi:nitroreductase
VDFGEALRRRRMVRRHTGDPVDPPTLDRIVEAGLSAPTAGNAQGVTFVVVTEPGLIGEIAEAAGEPGFVSRGFDPWVSSAGALIVVCAEPAVYRARYEEPDKDPSALDGPPWWFVDAGAALMAALLAATAEGVGAGFLGAHALPGLAAVLSIPADVEVVGIITLGPAAPDRRSSSLDRRRRTDRVHRNRW